MNPSDTKYNPANSGKLNEQPRQKLRPIIRNDRDRERNRVEAMKKYISATLNLTLDGD